MDISELFSFEKKLRLPIGIKIQGKFPNLSEETAQVCQRIIIAIFSL